jgi:hypothetical protein
VPPHRNVQTASERIRGILERSPAGSLLLAALGCLLFAPRLDDAGFYSDDWPITAIRSFDGPGGLYSELMAANHLRPLNAAWFSLTGAISGEDPGLHAAFALAAHLVAVIAVAALLRRAGLGRGHSLALGALLLVAPFRDSIWFWWAASGASVAIALAAAACIAAMKALDAAPGRALRWHAAACLLWVLSVFTYQSTASVVVLTLLLYLGRASRRAALKRWVADIASVFVAVVSPIVITGSSGAATAPVVGVADSIDHALLIVDQGLTLLSLVLVPFGSPRRDVVLSVAGLLLVAATVRGLRGDPAARAHTRRWLGWAGVGAAVAAFGYVIYIPGPASVYYPLGPGGDNRVNSVPVIGYVLFAYSAAMLVGGLLPVRRRAGWAPAVVAGAAIAVALGIGYTNRVLDDAAAWDRAAASQRTQLRVLKDLGRPAPESTTYVFGGLGLAAPGVPAFRVTWDLHAAAQILWDDPTLDTYPIFTGTALECQAKIVVPVGGANGNSPVQADTYGSVRLVDLKSRRTATVRTRADCERLVPTFVPGPVAEGL